MAVPFPRVPATEPAGQAPSSILTGHRSLAGNLAVAPQPQNSQKVPLLGRSQLSQASESLLWRMVGLHVTSTSLPRRFLQHEWTPFPAGQSPCSSTRQGPSQDLALISHQHSPFSLPSPPELPLVPQTLLQTFALTALLPT